MLASLFVILTTKSYLVFNTRFCYAIQKKVIQSFYRIYSKEFLKTGSIDFSDQAGFKQLYEAYNFASKHSTIPVIAIFADDLLQDPEKVFKYYCDQINLVPRAMSVRGLGWHWLCGNGMNCV